MPLDLVELLATPVGGKLKEAFSEGMHSNPEDFDEPIAC